MRLRFGRWEWRLNFRRYYHDGRAISGSLHQVDLCLLDHRAGSAGHMSDRWVRWHWDIWKARQHAI